MKIKKAYNHTLEQLTNSYNGIKQGYESGRTMAFNTRRLREREGENFLPNYSYALMREVDKVQQNNRDYRVGFWLYRFVNHFDCKVIDKAIKEAEDYVLMHPEPQKEIGLEEGVSGFVNFLQGIADEVNKGSELADRPKVKITSYPDWMF